MQTSFPPISFRDRELRFLELIRYFCAKQKSLASRSQALVHWTKEIRNNTLNQHSLHQARKNMAYTWAVIVAGISFLVYYSRLPWILCPVLLFGTYLASGGRSFPRVFFRTVLRDLRYRGCEILN